MDSPRVGALSNNHVSPKTNNKMTLQFLEKSLQFVKCKYFKLPSNFFRKIPLNILVFVAGSSS
jgi:hypothetical protein